MTRIARPGEVAQAIAAGEMRERSSTVAWLRAMASEPIPPNSDEALRWAASAIEQGKHEESGR